MVSWGVMFGVVIGQIVTARAPVDAEVVLSDLTFDPVKAHVHGLVSFLFDSVVGETCGGGIVCLKWSKRLWVA
jgi:hypothetical protein